MVQPEGGYEHCDHHVGNVVLMCAHGSHPDFRCQRFAGALAIITPCTRISAGSCHLIVPEDWNRRGMRLHFRAKAAARKSLVS
jgi:hypothetical protein